MIGAWILTKYLVIGVPLLLFYFEKMLPTTRNYLERTAWFILWVFCALRYGYGRDYFSYYYWYSELIPAGVDGFVDSPAFNILIELFLLLNLPYQAFVAFCSLIFLLSIKHVIIDQASKKDRFVIFAVFLLLDQLFFDNLNTIRQSLAIAISLLAMNLYVNERKVSGLFLLIFAPFFHLSTILTFPILIALFYFRNLGRSLMLLSSLGMTLFYDIFFIFLGSLGDIGFLIPDRYLQFNEFQLTFATLARFCLIAFLLTTALFLVKKKRIFSSIALSLCFGGICLWILSLTGFPIAARLEQFFAPGYLLICKEILSSNVVRRQVIIFCALIVFGGLSVQDYLEDEEYSKYTAQFRLIPFVDESDIASDLTDYFSEEKAFHELRQLGR